MAGWYTSVLLSTKIYLSPGHIVLDGDPASPKMGTSDPHFSAYVCCGQTAGWIRIPLGMEVGLGPGDIVLDGDPAPHPQKGAQHPHILADFVLAWSPISAAAEHL